MTLTDQISDPLDQRLCDLRHIVRSHAKLGHHGITGSRDAEAVDADSLSSETHIFAPCAGDSGFHCDASGASVWQHALDVVGVLPLETFEARQGNDCLLYTSPSPRDVEESRMPSSA